eukprot:366391-Chlamydomonas_euryale.AAC.28
MPAPSACGMPSQTCSGPWHANILPLQARLNPPPSHTRGHTLRCAHMPPFSTSAYPSHGHVVHGMGARSSRTAAAPAPMSRATDWSQHAGWPSPSGSPAAPPTAAGGLPPQQTPMPPGRPAIRSAGTQRVRAPAGWPQMHQEQGVPYDACEDAQLASKLERVPASGTCC